MCYYINILLKIPPQTLKSEFNYDNYIKNGVYCRSLNEILYHSGFDDLYALKKVGLSVNVQVHAEFPPTEEKLYGNIIIQK